MTRRQVLYGDKPGAQQNTVWGWVPVLGSMRASGSIGGPGEGIETDSRKNVPSEAAIKWQDVDHGIGSGSHLAWSGSSQLPDQAWELPDWDNESPDRVRELPEIRNRIARVNCMNNRSFVGPCPQVCDQYGRSRRGFAMAAYAEEHICRCC